MNLLFDLDGTLTDPKEGIVRSINHALRRLDYPERDFVQLEHFIGPPLKEIFQVLLNTRDSDLILQAVSYYREKYFNEGYLENKIYDDVPRMLESFRQQRFPMVVATSKRSDIAWKVIRHFDLDGYFLDVYGCDLDLSKGALLEIILRERGWAAQDCLMIGDRRHDVEAGRENGMRTVGVTWGYGTSEELSKATPDFVAKSPLHLIEVIAEAMRLKIEKTSRGKSV